MIPKGEYTFKVVNARINETKKYQKYIYLTLEVQDEGPSKGERIYLSIAPWNDFNWMNNIKSFFSEEDVQLYYLESRDEDTVSVVSQLILGETGKGVVKHFEHNNTPYASVMMTPNIQRDTNANYTFPV